MVKSGLGKADIAGIAEGFAFGDDPVLQPDPFQVIGQDQVAGQAGVFEDLVGLEELVKLFADFLGFQIADDALVVGLEFEIRGAFAGQVAPGFVNDLDFLSGQGF